MCKDLQWAFSLLSCGPAANPLAHLRTWNKSLLLPLAMLSFLFFREVFHYHHFGNKPFCFLFSFNQVKISPFTKNYNSFLVFPFLNSHQVYIFPVCLDSLCLKGRSALSDSNAKVYNIRIDIFWSFMLSKSVMPGIILLAM